MSESKIIRVAALVLSDSEGRVLTVRKQGTSRFMQPGGKPEPGENPAETALREVREEVGLQLQPEQLIPMGEFSAPAANEPDHTVVCHNFRVTFDAVADDLLGQLRPAAEIAEIRWIPLEQLRPAEDVAPLLSEQVAPWLRAERSRAARQQLLGQLGAQLPVVAAPMAGGPSTPELVIAAAQAGALGFLAAGYRSPEQLAQQIQAVRQQTSLFGVNLFAPHPVPVNREEFTSYAEQLTDWAQRYESLSGTDEDDQVKLPEPREDDDAWAAKVQLLVENPPPVVSFTFGLAPAQDIRRLQQAGALTVQTITSVDEALAATEAGVDGLIVQSHEAGGHSGTWSPQEWSPQDWPARIPPAQPSLLQLLSQVRAATDLPLWGAGGIGTAEQVKDLLHTGAEAAVVGTVLLRSDESGTQPAHQQALTQLHRETVVTTAFSGRPARALVNDFTERFTATAPLGFPAVHYLTSPLRQAAAAAGDPEGLNLWAGTGWRHARPGPAAEILRDLSGQLSL